MCFTNGTRVTYFYQLQWVFLFIELNANDGYNSVLYVAADDPWTRRGGSKCWKAKMNFCGYEGPCKQALLWDFWPGEWYVFHLLKSIVFFHDLSSSSSIQASPLNQAYWLMEEFLWCHDVNMTKYSRDYWLQHDACMVMYVLHPNACLLTSSFSFMQHLNGQWEDLS